MELFYREYGQAGFHLLIMHGLLGSGRNWHTVSGKLQSSFQIIVPDLRNHGRSMHSDEHHTIDMATDVIELLKRKKINSTMLLGHSMGGLVAMELAFQAPEFVEGIIVVDMVPKPHLSSVRPVLQAMLEVNPARYKNKSEIDLALEKSITNLTVRQFVMTNLKKSSRGYEWRVNLPALSSYLQEAESFRPSPTDIYRGAVLFIRGGKSDYISEADFTIIKHHFPNAQIKTVQDAGHWVHHDAPAELIKLIDQFSKSL